jgi:type IV secretory pathway VirB2 component (pilin)
MMRRIAAVGIVAGLVLLLSAPLAHAFDAVDCEGLDLPADQCKLVGEDKLNYKSNDNVVWTVVQFIMGVLGGIAVVMVVVGGIQYATSQGESAALAKAKNTILYSVIGLVVAIAATSIVTFIINNIPK